MKTNVPVVRKLLRAKILKSEELKKPSLILVSNCAIC